MTKFNWFEMLGADSALVAAITRWTELDLSRPFQLFYRDLRLRVDSYALVVANQETIFATLCRHLEASHLDSVGWTAVPALLEFFVSLATDLASDFHKFFHAAFDSLKRTDLQKKFSQIVTKLFLKLIFQAHPPVF